MADVKIVVSMDSKAAEEATKRIDGELKKLGKETGETGKQTQAFGQQLTGNLIPAFTVATLAADAIRKTFRFLKDSIIDSVGAAIEAEKVDRALESTLQIVGQSAGGTAEKLKAYATQLSRQTIYDDEAIKSAQALIIQMRGTTSQIDLATKGAIGLASVFSMDLQSAARAVAQGFEGNYRQLGMLIPAIREAKTESEKHAAMIDFLAGAYQRAEAETKTFGGRLADVKKTYNELQEAIGGFVTQNQAVIETLSGVKEIIIWLDRNIKSLEKPKGLKLFELTAPGALMKALRGIGETAKKANDDWEASFEGMTMSMFAFRKTAIDPIPIIIEQKFIAPLTASQIAIEGEIRWLQMLGSQSVWGPVHNNFGSLGEMIGDGLGAAIDFVEPKADGLFDGLVKQAKGATREFKRTAEAVKEILEAVERYRDTGGAALGALDAVIQQGTTNRMIALDAEYQKRLTYINSNVTDEGKRLQMIAQLDDEFAEKRKKAAHALGLSTKAIAISNAIISTHEAAAKAMAQGGFILGIPWSLIIEALGWIQVGLIAAQPIPLAKGGYFKKPTLMPGADGRDYLGGEAGAEIMSPVPVMRQIVREESGRARAISITIAPGAVVVYAQTLDDEAIERARTKLTKMLTQELRLNTAFAGRF